MSSFVADVSSIDEAWSTLRFWQSFDLEAKRGVLDATILEISQYKAASATGRKKLNELTRVFRSKLLASEEQSTLIFDLVKAYQDEIDQLSTRSKYVESKFNLFYKDLMAAPDPKITLSTLLEMNNAAELATSQLEIDRLRAALADYDREFQQLKNQDITIRRLEEQLEEFDRNIESKIEDELTRRTSEVEELASGRINEVVELQKIAERRLLAALEASSKAQMQAEQAQSQLFDITSKSEDRNSHLQETNNLLQEKLENAMSKLVAYEEEISGLRNTSSPHGSGKTKDLEEISVTINEFQVIIDELRHKLVHKEEELLVEKEKYNRMLTDMSDTIAANHALIETLKVDLNRRPSQEEFVDVAMKLKTLQSVVYTDPDHEDRQIFTYAEALNYNNMLNIDHLVSNKLKVLESELMETRRQFQSLQEIESGLRKDYNAVTKESQDTKVLISKLENDLHQMSSSNGKANTGNVDRTHHNTDLVELLGGEDIAKSKSPVPSNPSGAVNNNDNMVNILQAQRDRYKEKLNQTDNLVMSLQQRIETLTNEKQQLQSDNVVLYGKVKYASSYNNYGMTPVKVQLDRMGALELGNGILNDDEHTRYVEKKYEALYEQKLNPFTEFSEREKKRRTEELQLLDRIILNTALNLLSTNMGRLGLAIYIGCIHVLVFFVLIYVSSHVHHGCDPTLDHH